MTRPECTCDVFVFAQDAPWRVEIHATDCPVFCDCYFRTSGPVPLRPRGGWVGRRGQVMHLETCGWYEPPREQKAGRIRGAHPLYMILDETT